MRLSSVRVGLVVAIVTLILSTPADAFKKINLPGTRSKDYIKSLCTQAGGTYAEGQGQYGCYSNCGDSGKESDACGINCKESDNTCYGWNPGRRRPSTNPASVLRPAKGTVKWRQ